MFNFDKLNQVPDTVVAENYSIECDGHLLAMEEAYGDLADINAGVADVNNGAVDAYLEGMQSGGEAGAQAALESFQGGAVMEGFLSNVKDRVLKALKSLKEKLMAFFESAHKYFDAIFKSGQAFAAKYGDELKKKDLSGFKYEMFDYDLGAVSIKDIFTKVKATIDKKCVMTSDANAEKGSEKKKAAVEVMHLLCGETVSNREGFRKAIVKKMHKGATQKRERDVNIGAVVDALTDGEELDDCKEAKSDCESSFNDEISKIEGLKEEAGEGGAGKKIRFKYSLFLESKDISLAVFDAYKSVVKERNSAYKSCLSSALHYSPKK